MENTISTINEKQVGKVRVKSGQLLLIDPCHIDGRWKYDEGPERIELWGDDNNAVRTELARSYPEMNMERRPPGVYAITLSPELSASKVNRRIAQAARKLKASSLVAVPQVDDSLNECFEGVCNTKRGGEVLDKHAVVAMVGPGNGLYPAYANYGACGGIAALTIKLAKDSNTKEGRNTRKKVRRIGSVPVDSGQVMVIDPANIPNEIEMMEIWKDCCGLSTSQAGAGPILRTLAIATSTAFGDGCYPVYATYDEENQIVEITIRFMPGDWLKS